jgi:BirA family biotin operon repressor/biotin-[acetyl-CoA-carboxylase] ligase
MIKKSFVLEVFFLSFFYLSCFTTPWHEQDTPPNIQDRYFPVVGSTQEEMKTLFLKNLNPRNVLRVWTTDQTEGKGYESRSWYCPKGNLAASFGIFWPSHRLDLISAAQLVTGVSIIEALRKFGLKQDFYLRWPNDIISKDGRKIAGILFEPGEISIERYAPLIIGIGINVKMTEEEAQKGQRQPEIKQDAMGLPFTSLFMESGIMEDPSRILEELTQELVQNFRTLLIHTFRGKFFGFISSHLAYKGQEVIYKDSGKNAVEEENLTVVDIGPKDGRIIFLDEKGRRRERITGRIFPQHLRS